MLPVRLVQICICAVCNTEYREAENIGQHLCRIHPCVSKQRLDGSMYYPCCNLTLADFYLSCKMPRGATNGCLRVDHMDAEIDNQDEARRTSQLRAMCVEVVPLAFLPRMRDPLHESLLVTVNSKRSLTRFECGGEALRITVGLGDVDCDGFEVVLNLVAMSSDMQRALYDMYKQAKNSRWDENKLLVCAVDQLQKSSGRRVGVGQSFWKNTIAKEVGVITEKRATKNVMSFSDGFFLPFCVVRRIASEKDSTMMTHVKNLTTQTPLFCGSETRQYT